MGESLIDFSAKTVAITEHIPIRIEIITERIGIEKSIFEAKIINITIPAVPYKIIDIKRGFSEETNLKRKFTKKYPMNAINA